MKRGEFNKAMKEMKFLIEKIAAKMHVECKNEKKNNNKNFLRLKEKEEKCLELGWKF